MLETEIKTFDSKLPEWLKQYPGRVVLVKDERLVGVFDNEQDALEHGAREFGLSSFLIRRVQPQQPNAQAPALTLGVIHGRPAFSSAP